MASSTTVVSEGEFIFMKAAKASRCSEASNLNTMSQEHGHDVAEASALAYLWTRSDEQIGSKSKGEGCIIADLSFPGAPETDG